jgi:hypothetical protein
MLPALILTMVLLPGQPDTSSSFPSPQEDFDPPLLFPAATYQPEAPQAAPVPTVIAAPLRGPPRPTTGGEIKRERTST